MTAGRPLTIAKVLMLTDAQIERYSRHIILKEVGGKGQQKLFNGRVLIIGAGALGSPAALYLAAAGVGLEPGGKGIAEAGHQAVIKPPPLRSAVPGGYTVDDFTVDERAGTATCPNTLTRQAATTANKATLPALEVSHCPYSAVS